jgi:hypothetical protein
MKIITMFVLASVLGAASLAAEEQGPCYTGKLVDFDTRTQVVEGFRNEHYEVKTKANGKKVGDGYSYGGTQTQVTYVLTVAVGEMTYTAEQAKSILFGYNPTDMVVNDPVNVRVEKKKLIFLRPNGKEYKTTIVRMERNPGQASRTDISVDAVASDRRQTPPSPQPCRTP